MTAVSAQLDFIKPLDIYTKEKPYQLFLAKPKSRQDVDLTNVEVDTVPNIPLHDVRGREDDFRIDEHGFQYIKHDQTFRAFDDPQRVNDEFLPQVVKVIKDHIPCAERVHVYDWRVIVYQNPWARRTDCKEQKTKQDEH
ncbi:hypothetical protein SPI_09138 [Niveomyces insectorum RCEF 264]|uniref:Uncharacterized protein n=1 Tax=Niveomyces insectorum RCEF 264 TaxID=1081102 RepID=A0A167M4Y0_9HYPO|nr:hypothetical protein SPI_09138 [Niveomyces insectorum RCEF 264]